MKLKCFPLRYNLFVYILQELSLNSQGILTLEASNGNVHVVKNEYKVSKGEIAAFAVVNVRLIR